MTPAVCGKLQLCQTLCDPMDCSPHTPTPLGDSPGKNIGVGCQLPCPPPGGLPDPGIEPTFLLSAASAGGFFTTNATQKSEKP